MDILDQYTITSDRQTKAFVHPRRMAMLRLIGDQELTISDMAAALSVTPGSLSHHLKILLENGLVVLSQQKKRHRQTLKYYRATAKRFHLQNDDSVTGLNGKVLGLLRDDLDAAMLHLGDKDEEFVFGLLKNAHIKKQDLKKFCAQLTALLSDFASSDADDTEDLYAMNLSLYRQQRDWSGVGSIHLSKEK